MINNYKREDAFFDKITTKNEKISLQQKTRERKLKNIYEQHEMIKAKAQN